MKNASIFCICLLVATPAAAEMSEQVMEELRDLDLSEGANFEIVPDAAGNALGVLGRFAVNLDSVSSFDPTAVGDAVADFIAAHAEAWGHEKGFRPKLLPGDVVAVDQYTHVAFFTQAIAGLNVLDGGITATFWSDGSLASVNGVVANWGPVEDEPDLADIAAAFATEDVIVEDGTVERGLSLQYGGVVWEYRSDGHLVVLDEATRVIVRTDDGIEHLPVGPCNIARRNFPRSGSTATSLVEGSGTLTEEITCEANDVFGTCDWQLRRELVNFQHGIDRVLDGDGAEAQVSQACSSGNVPQFTATNGDSLREQGAFYVENQMRFFIDQNVWSQVANSLEDNVQITVDDSGVTRAEFNPATRNIRCNQNCTGFGCCDQDVLSHEYGHYVVFTYGGSMDNQCSPGADEGNALDETLANAFGLLFWLDDDQTNAQYGALDGYAGNNGPLAHTNGTNDLTAAPSCPNGDAPNAEDGQPFLQAAWELMFNRDCTLDTCATTSGFGNRIWPTLGEETVLTRVGASLGFALSVLGTNNITHDLVRAQMRARILNDADLDTATRAQRVFSHHGLNCPTCCTGC